MMVKLVLKFRTDHTTNTSAKFQHAMHKNIVVKNTYMVKDQDKDKMWNSSCHV